MALDFPNAPTNGQSYEGFIYDSTTGAWRSPVFWRQDRAVISGGTTVTTGGYEYHTFTSDGTLTVAAAGYVELLVVLVVGVLAGCNRFLSGFRLAPRLSLLGRVVLLLLVRLSQVCAAMTLLLRGFLLLVAAQVAGETLYP